MKIFILYAVLILTLTTSQLSYGSETNQIDNTFSCSPFLIQEVRDIIVRESALEQALCNKPMVDLALVCKEWHTVIKMEAQVKRPLRKILQGVADKDDDATYDTFLNGKLVYSIPVSDEKKIEWKISDFLNPFKGTFNLSKCGDIAKDLTITTDPSVFFQITKDHHSCHILIAPYFLIKKYVTSSAKSFERVIKDWEKNEAPVGLFWRSSGWEDLSRYDSLTFVSLSHICSMDLCNNWAVRAYTVRSGLSKYFSHCENFWLIFEAK